MNQNAIPGNETEGQQVYLSCSAEDLIAIEMEAWRSGYEAATISESVRLHNLAAIEEAAEGVCDQALYIYIPLDLTRFRDVFIRAWCGGYCMRMRELGWFASAPVSH